MASLSTIVASPNDQSAELRDPAYLRKEGGNKPSLIVQKIIQAFTLPTIGEFTEVNPINRSDKFFFFFFLLILDHTYSQIVLYLSFNQSLVKNLCIYVHNLLVSCENMEKQYSSVYYGLLFLYRNVMMNIKNRMYLLWERLFLGCFPTTRENFLRRVGIVVINKCLTINIARRILI